MVTAQELKALMSAQPFVPFRICMSDGKTYEVPNHDVMLVNRNTVFIGVSLDADDIAERTVICAILHIARIEHNIPAKAA